ncbi:MAG: DUF4349 domain-containing protein [Thermofilaceae archaeon]|nr:DUF4349 domain-containing protein [Thermofilaceae archaeon]MCX8180972.1 DUF4349 domain-containing protein [Thermofilaceae archaeon]MDW8004077.1 DUF4349 domain-containing protein [Thermofilaceae archaeon]
MKKLSSRQVLAAFFIVAAFGLGMLAGSLLSGVYSGYWTQEAASTDLIMDTGLESGKIKAVEKGKTVETSSTKPTFTIPEGRKITLEGFVRLRVGEGAVERTAEELAKVAVRLGGYTGETNVREDWGYVVLRVPSERFDEALEEVKKLGTTVEVTTSARDVTEQYVDLSARLNTSKTLEQRLLRMLEQARNVEEMLKVEEYLSRVRAEIEMYTAQLKNLERMIQYSTLYVYLEAPPKEVKPIVQFPTFDPLPAVANAVKLLYSVIYTLITALIGLSPLAAIGVAGYLGYRKLKGQKQSKESELKSTG